MLPFLIYSEQPCFKWNSMQNGITFYGGVCCPPPHAPLTVFHRRPPLPPPPRGCRKWQSAKNDNVLGTTKVPGSRGGRAAWVRGGGFANPCLLYIILYLQMGVKRNPSEPTNFIREQLGSRVPMTPDWIGRLAPGVVILGIS